MIDRGIARQGYPVRAAAARQVGVVTSGTQTPFLKKAIGMAYVPTELARRGHRDRHRRPRPRLEGAHRHHCRSIRQGAGRRSERMAYPADLKYTKDHEWIRVSRRRRRGRHHRLRAGAARRRGLRRAARRRPPRERRRSRSDRSSRSRRSPSSSRRWLARSSRSIRRSKDHPETVNTQAARDVDGAAAPVGSERRRVAARQRGSTSASSLPRCNTLDATDWFAPRHIGPSPDERDRMLQTVGVVVARRADRRGHPRVHPAHDAAEPAAAGERASVSAPSGASGAPQHALPLLHRPRLSRHDHAERRPADGDGEPRLVHAIHAVSGRDRAGPPRVAPQLPDDGDGVDGDGGGERVAAG